VLLHRALQVYHSVLLTMPRCRLYELERGHVRGPVPHLISAREDLVTRDGTVLDEYDPKTRLIMAADGLTCASISETEVKLWNSVGECSSVQMTAPCNRLTSYSHACMSADGTRIALLSPSGLALVDAVLYETVQTWCYGDGVVEYGHLSISSNGSVVAFAATTKTSEMTIHIGRHDSTGFWTLRGATADIDKCVLALSGSGDYLAVTLEASRSTQVWDIPGHTLFADVQNEDGIYALNFAPNDAFLVIYSKDETYAHRKGRFIKCQFIKSPNSSSRLIDLQRQGGDFRAVSFSPDSYCVILHCYGLDSQIIPLHELFDPMELHTQGSESRIHLSSVFTFSCDSDGWICFNSARRSPRKLCWIPPNQRWNLHLHREIYLTLNPITTSLRETYSAHRFVTSGTRVAFTSGNDVTIIDFAAAVDFLCLR
jgi:hypothetical protein